MLAHCAGAIPRGADSAVVSRHVMMQPDKAGMQLTPMLRGLPHPSNHQMTVLTLEDSIAAQILEAMSPKTSVAARSHAEGIASTSVPAASRVGSLSSPKSARFSAQNFPDDCCDWQHPPQSSATESPKKQAYESSDNDDEDDRDSEQYTDSDFTDMDGGMILSEEVQREILTRPPKPEGDAEWRVEWSSEQRCWSWIHHQTHGQIFANPLEMDKDARDRAAASGPVAVFEDLQQNQLQRPGQRPAAQIWTVEEEEQLKNLVAESGAGDWSTKSSLFHTHRSASALRHRWYSVHAHGQSDSDRGLSIDIHHDGGPVDETRGFGASSWTKEEDDALRAVGLKPSVGATLFGRASSTSTYSSNLTRACNAT